MNFLTLMLSACSNAYFMSYNLTVTNAVIDGGATNRIWVFVRQYFLLMVCFSPLYMLFPAASFAISLSFYSSLTFLGALNYIASICHTNQIKLNGAREGELDKLPFGLHNQPKFSQGVLFLARNLTYVMFASYILGLGAFAFSGAYFFVGFATGMLMIDQVYKNGWMPEFLEKPYSYATTFLLFNVVFSGAVSATLILINASILGWDYIQLHIYKVRRGTNQFPFASAKQEKIIIPGNTQELNILLTKLNSTESHCIRITFNHFEEANTVSDKFLISAPAVDFNQYAILFDNLDFTSQMLRDNLVNEMADHDLYSEKSHEQHRCELKLSPNTAISDIQIAWLKREMHYMVKKLVFPSYKELTHQTVITMHGQARYLLSFLLNTHNQEVKENILLSLAVQTGSHCNGKYVDTFAELSHQYAFQQATLTTRERVILAAQSIREDQFRNYYYNIIPQLKDINEGFKFMSQSIDFNDYHTYESYVSILGGAYYLRNPNMHKRAHTIFTIIGEYSVDSMIAQHTSDGTLKKGRFSDYYNSEILLKEILKGKLHSYFMMWCEEKCPGSYHAFVLDVETSFVKVDSLYAIKLAELMLLDLGLVESQELSSDEILWRKYLKESRARQSAEFEKSIREGDILPTFSPQKNHETSTATESTLRRLSFLNSIEHDVQPDEEETKMESAFTF